MSAPLRFCLLLVSVSLLACTSDLIRPTPELVAGEYRASTFRVSGVDILSMGASLEMELFADRTVQGRLMIPEAAGGPLDADLEGTYYLAGTGVTFQQAADTFVRDAAWLWEDGFLVGSFTKPVDTVFVELRRN